MSVSTNHSNSRPSVASITARYSNAIHRADYDYAMLDLAGENMMKASASRCVLKAANNAYDSIISFLNEHPHKIKFIGLMFF